MPEYNVILAGQYGVGKSSLFYRLRSGEPPEGVTEGITSRNTTRTWGDDDGGVDNFIYKKQIDGRQVNVSL